MRPLHWAASFGRPAVARALVEAGAERTGTDLAGRSAAELAGTLGGGDKAKGAVLRELLGQKVARQGGKWHPSSLMARPP